MDCHLLKTFENNQGGKSTEAKGQTCSGQGRQHRPAAAAGGGGRGGSTAQQDQTDLGQDTNGYSVRTAGRQTSLVSRAAWPAIGVHACSSVAGVVAPLLNHVHAPVVTADGSSSGAAPVGGGMGQV